MPVTPHMVPMDETVAPEVAPAAPEAAAAAK
jgi:hypothetical protein